MKILTVYDKKTDEPVEVYDITYDANGFPYFLIFCKNQWVRKSAKHFAPYPSYEEGWYE